ncbi:hypothetical protein FEM48_Zijuj08G0164200 [Ziziphus jujuba var. spinosa]|uniref:Uncharacterized protein n=1 Tax=Ziziphus jujuba var. spinosa TaxID=714518 RepID=A0A978V053_ZIZJJ|nr:hypothetical protein FEM48_Zijuj08G0164200 [Ziziphus jujuba var. spinosa]
MDKNNFTDGFCKTRPVLGDLTNRLVKRGFSTVFGDSGLESKDGYGKNVDVQDGDSRFTKQVCLGVENLVRDKCQAKFGEDKSEKGFNFSKETHAYGSSSTSSDADTSEDQNVERFMSNAPKGIKKKSNLLDGCAHQSVMDVGDASRDSCLSSGSMPTCSGPCKKDGYGAGENYQDYEERNTSDVTQGNLVREGLATLVCKNNEDCVAVGKLAASKYGSIEWSRLPKSQSSKFHELGRCTALKGEVYGNLNAGDDLLKSCSCSFCLKAAYIWSDLQYQDIKGRIASLKKSQKEANTLVQKSYRGKESSIHSQENANKSTKLEADLTGQWRSLFLRMEDILANESGQLQASFVALKDLRESCKMDLGMINEMPTEKR